MTRLDVTHPFFRSIECDATGCLITLSDAFPIASFRLSVVGGTSDLVEVASDLGYRHPDGAVDWIRGAGTTIEEAAIDATQFFLNLVAHPGRLSPATFVWRSEIS